MALTPPASNDRSHLEHAICARVLIARGELKRLAATIAALYNATVIDRGMIMSGGMLTIRPGIVVLIHIRNRRVAGWGTGAVKG